MPKIEPPNLPGVPERQTAFSSLHHRDFRLLWIGQIVSITGSQMQLAAINWHIYLLTRSPLALGLVGACRAIPIILCSLVGGVVADVVDRRRLMMTTQAVMPTLVPLKDFPNAVSLSMLMFQVGLIGGPPLAGFVLASHGPGFVYTINAVSFVAVILGLALMRTSGRPEKDESQPARISFDALREGLRFVWRTPIIVQTMTLDFVATFFASANQLLPIFAKDILRVGAEGYGFLAAAPAGGAIITGLIVARFGKLEKQGLLVIVSIGVFGAATIAFGLSRVFWFSLLMLAITGGADTISTILRQTIRQLVTPNKLRGRMTSINMIFFMGGPQLGEVEAGTVAALVGAPLSVVTGGAACLIAAIIALGAAKNLRRYEVK